MNKQKIRDEAITVIVDVLKYHFGAPAIVVKICVWSFKLIWHVFIVGLLNKLERKEEGKEFLHKAEGKFNEIKEIKDKNKHKTLLEAILESKKENKNGIKT